MEWHTLQQKEHKNDYVHKEKKLTNSFDFPSIVLPQSYIIKIQVDYTIKLITCFFKWILIPIKIPMRLQSNLRITLSGRKNVRLYILLHSQRCDLKIFALKLEHIDQFNFLPSSLPNLLQRKFFMWSDKKYKMS